MTDEAAARVPKLFVYIEFTINAEDSSYFSGMVVSKVLVLLRPAGSLFCDCGGCCCCCCCFCALGEDLDEELAEVFSTRSSRGMSSTGSRQKLKLEYSSYLDMSSSFSRIGGNR